MGKVDPNPRPAWAVTMWISDNEQHIYVELPMTTGGPPFIQRYDADVKGILTALRVLKARRVEVVLPTLDHPANYTPPAHQPQVKVIGRESKLRQKLHSETTEAQREAALILINKMGYGKR